MHFPGVAGSDLIGPDPSRSSELLLHAVQRMADEQSGVRTVREQREKRCCGWWRLPLKIEQLPVRPHWRRSRHGAPITLSAAYAKSHKAGLSTNKVQTASKGPWLKARTAFGRLQARTATRLTPEMNRPLFDPKHLRIAAEVRAKAWRRRWLNTATALVLLIVTLGVMVTIVVLEQIELHVRKLVQ
jgi:hypothetical protein